MFSSCVSLKLATTQTSSDCEIAISGEPDLNELAFFDRLSCDEAVFRGEDLCI